MPVVSLTGPDSHEIHIPDGVGNLYVGPRTRGANEPHAVVDPDEALDWSAFEAIDLDRAYPWPRWITYEGNDLGVFAWAARRPIERLVWRPTRAVSADVRAANLGRLHIALDVHEVSVELPENARLWVEGRASMLRPSHPAEGRGVDLSFLRLSHTEPVPRYETLVGVLALSTDSARGPADAAAIAFYSETERLSIRGPLERAALLAKLGRLRSVEMREVWNLREFPPLSSWPSLERLFVHGVPKSEGTRLRREAKARTEVKATISGLKTPEWIRDNATSPFRNWGRRASKHAKRAYEEAANELRAESARPVIERLVDALNEIHRAQGLETSHREDAAFAVAHLLATSDLGQLTDAAMGWFDNRRDF